MSDSGQNRTEQATPRKRQKATRKGDVVDSRDLSSGFALFGMACTFILAGSIVADGLRGAMRDFMGGLAAAPTLGTESGSVAVLRETIGTAAGILAPFLGMIVLLGVGAQVTMHGLVYSPEKLGFRIDKVNPFTGFKRIFGISGFIRALFGVLKLAAIAAIVVLTVRGRWPEIVRLGELTAIGGISVFLDVVLSLLLRVAIAVLVLGVADYAFQRWKKERDLRMTQTEVKEERRQTEGDPHVRSKIRSKMRERALHRMMSDVDTATVVVANPTHFAVALRYDRGESPAPKVVAKGVDHLARRIRERAEEAGVPVVEEPPLARSLYRLCRIGEFIPTELYRAVAAVLSFVFRQRGAP